MIKLLAAILLGVSLYGASNDENGTENNASIFDQEYWDNKIDTSHEYISHKVQVISSNVDKQAVDILSDANETKESENDVNGSTTSALSDYFSGFFKDERYLDNNNRSYLRVRLSPEYNKLDKNRWRIDFSFYLNLPHTEDSLKLFIGEDIEDQLDNKTPNPDAGDPNVGVKYFFPEFVQKLNISLTGGVSGVDPYARFVIRYPFHIDSWLFEPYQRIEYSIDDEWYEETILYFDKRLSSRDMFRLRLQRESETHMYGQRLSAVLSYFNTLKYDQGINAYIAVVGDTEYFKNHPEYIPTKSCESVGIDNYCVGVVWKEQFYREWLFYEIEPIIEWDRRYRYDENYIFRATLEAWFGNI